MNPVAAASPNNAKLVGSGMAVVKSSPATTWMRMSALLVVVAKSMDSSVLRLSDEFNVKVRSTIESGPE